MAPKTMVLPSADKIRLCIKNILYNKQPSLAADGYTAMSLPCLTIAFCQF
jgi:hypothetical protein